MRAIEVDIDTNITVKSDTVPLVRATGTTLLMFKFSLNAAVAGVNSLTLKLYGIPNPSSVSGRIFVQELDTSVFPPMVVTEAEASAAATKMVRIPNDYGAISIEYTRSGAGTNSFHIVVYRSP